MNSIISTNTKDITLIIEHRRKKTRQKSTKTIFMMQYLSFSIPSILGTKKRTKQKEAKMPKHTNNKQKLNGVTKLSKSRETTYQFLAILGRKNPTISIVEKTEYILSKKNMTANQIVENIINQALMFRSVSEEKLKKATDFVDLLIQKNSKKQKCHVCEKHKDIANFYVDRVKRNCCLTCYRMGVHS